MKILFLGYAVGFGLLGIPTARADEANEAAKGAVIAHAMCSGCHEVEQRPVLRPPAENEAPSFAWIATEHPEYVDGVLLRPPHDMWNIFITEDQAIALKAYLNTLRGQAPK